MAGNTIITIGRQFGSNGKEIGRRLAKKLDIGFYDKELLKRAAKESGMCEEIFHDFDEKPTNSFLYSLVMDPYAAFNFQAGMDIPLNHKVFLAAFDAIKKIADQESCVIVGRCADYALEEYENCLSVFIYTSMEDRIKIICDRLDMKPDKAKDMIVKADKQRSSYYNYYTTKKWGAVGSYDICIDSGLLGIDGTVDLIIDILNKRKQANT